MRARHFNPAGLPTPRGTASRSKHEPGGTAGCAANVGGRGLPRVVVEPAQEAAFSLGRRTKMTSRLRRKRRRGISIVTNGRRLMSSVLSIQVLQNASMFLSSVAGLQVLVPRSMLQRVTYPPC